MGKIYIIRVNEKVHVQWNLQTASRLHLQQRRCRWERVRRMRRELTFSLYKCEVPRRGRGKPKRKRRGVDGMWVYVCMCVCCWRECVTWNIRERSPPVLLTWPFLSSILIHYVTPVGLSQNFMESFMILPHYPRLVLTDYMHSILQAVSISQKQHHNQLSPKEISMPRCRQCELHIVISKT